MGLYFNFNAALADALLNIEHGLNSTVGSSGLLLEQYPSTGTAFSTLPVSVIVNRYQAATPEESMKQFVQDMTANAKPPAAPQPVSATSPMAAEAPNQEGLGAPMNRPPMTA